tara:strand:+ start:1416 stop:1610 length:195 start_codon:yes stop_codon:yes gene_type:complete
MSLATDPEFSRWFAANRRNFIDKYGLKFWYDLVDALQVNQTISALPKKFQNAYRSIKRKPQENL